MSEAHKIIHELMEEAGAARAHFHTWRVLRNLALPEFYETMNDLSYVDFFHTSNSGHYNLFFLALSKIYDRDPRVSGISQLKDVLRHEDHEHLAEALETSLISMGNLVALVMNIRNKTIVHNERGLSREKVYEINGVTPNEIQHLIDVTCEAINDVARGLGLPNRIAAHDRHERATMSMLERLRNGKTR